MALLGAFAQIASGATNGAATLIFFQEAGTLVALFGASRAKASNWKVVTLRGTVCCSLVLAAGAMLSEMVGPGALYALGFFIAMLLAYIRPATARGAYEYVARTNSSPLLRKLGAADAVVQMLGPVAVGAAVEEYGLSAVLFGLALIMSVASVCAISLRQVSSSFGDSGFVQSESNDRIRLTRPLTVIVGVSLVEHLLVSAFFAAFAASAVSAGWNARELGLVFSLVYLGTLLSMACPIPSRTSARWALFLVAAGLVPALLRFGFLVIDMSDRQWLFGLLLVTGAAIGIEQLLFGVLKFQYVPPEQASSLQRWTMGGAASASVVGAGLSALGVALGEVQAGLAVSIVAGLATLVCATVALILWFDSQDGRR